MAKRPANEQVAIRLWASGKGMEEISQELDVSLTTLYKWKAESKTPGETMDEWDKARANARLKRDSVERTSDLYDEWLTYLEGMLVHERTPSMYNSLVTIVAAAKGLGKFEEEIKKKVLAKAADTVEAAAKQQGMTSDQADFWRRQILGVR